jgi:hypothetical protein
VSSNLFCNFQNSPTAALSAIVSDVQLAFPFRYSLTCKFCSQKKQLFVTAVMEFNDTNPSAMENKENGSITSPTSPASNSSLKQRDLNDAVRENGSEEESESSEDESSDESSVDDPHLSEYGEIVSNCRICNYCIIASC